MSLIFSTKNIQVVTAVVAILFGILTVFAGTRVLLGANPGYEVFQPLLAFNTSMGFIYIVAGIFVWKNLSKGKTIAAVIFVLNFIVLMVIAYLYVFSNSIAIESLGAMSFRSLLWLILLALLTWASKKISRV